jgi:hypothetical protein
MATIEQLLLVKTTLSNGDTMVYQEPISKKASITQVCICNTHSGPVTVNVAITNSSATSSAVTDRFFHEMSLSANETMMVITNMPLSDRGKIWANASVNNVVNLFITGYTTTTE